MHGRKRIRDYGIVIGEMTPGERNSITDVNGVTVGHSTIDIGDVKTGVTAILPHEGNIFVKKVMATIHVINGFGKTAGIMQIEELGTIETPILLTSTLNVGLAFDALVDYVLEQNETACFINPVVCECNDYYLNDVRGRHVRKEHVFEAINSAACEFLEGDAGAGKGMSCYELKGGIGTASRIFKLGESTYTLGVLVLTNFGVKQDLIINGIKAGKLICQETEGIQKHENIGSVIVISATDVPVTERQAKRIAKRACIGLNRTGSIISHGSGEVSIAFCTSNNLEHNPRHKTIDIKMINEEALDIVFRAVVESTEEAVLNSMICAGSVTGNMGNSRHSLAEYIERILR